MRHPAKFSEPIIDQIEQMLMARDFRGRILDPFAGVGGVHKLSRRHPDRWQTVGVELEPEWANARKSRNGTIVGDALNLPFPDGSFDAISTSPCYGNRMSDHHDARDGSKRNTYKHTLGRDLHPNNAGSLQWGDEYREFHRKAWVEALRVLRDRGLFVLNISDHIRKGVREPVSAWHIRTLIWNGRMSLRDVTPVATRRLREGANRDVRVDYEYLALFEKVA